MSSNFQLRSWGVDRQCGWVSIVAWVYIRRTLLYIECVCKYIWKQVCSTSGACKTEGLRYGVLTVERPSSPSRGSVCTPLAKGLGARQRVRSTCAHTYAELHYCHKIDDSNPYMYVHIGCVDKCIQYNKYNTRVQPGQHVVHVQYMATPFCILHTPSYSYLQCVTPSRYMCK